MDKIINFTKKNKYKIFIFSIVLICSIAISIAIYSDITNKKIINNANKEDNKEDLKSNFNNIFTSTENEYVYNKYKIEEQENGKYNVNVKIPYLKMETPEAKGVNTAIEIIFGKKLKEIAKGTEQYIIYNVDYTTFVSSDILSLVIKCTLKEGTTAQRVIIQTYNYDLTNNKILELNDLIEIKQLNKEDVQSKIDSEIDKIIKEKQIITNEGYNIYTRIKR